MATPYVDFSGRLVMLGCGGIGQTVLPLLGNHLENIYSRTTVITSDEAGRRTAEKLGARFIHANITPGNFRRILSGHLGVGDVLLNLSIGIGSLDLIRFSSECGALYVDTSIEPWPDVFDNPMLELHERTNYALREIALKLARELGPDAPTAVMDHGANPGIVSHFVKRALINLDREIGSGKASPKNREDWARLARDLGIRTIQISERDTQASSRPKRQGEFINTWSVDGLIDELMQPVEFAYGTFEKHRPEGALEHADGSGTLYLPRPGASTFARSWVPSIGSFQGMLVPHDEVFSLADYLTIREGDATVYRPSVMFVYHPCDDAMLSALELEGNGWAKQPRRRRLGTDIVEGMDELGVLLAGHERNAYWFGSQLTIDEARKHAAHTNATTMQVVAGVMSGLLWALKNPRRGAVEPEDLDYEECLSIAEPYLGELVGEFTDWTPLDGRGKFFAELLDDDNPWQFQNIRSRQWTAE